MGADVDEEVFRAEAERFVRATLAIFGETPSEEKINKTISRIVKAFKPLWKRKKAKPAPES